MIKKRAIDYFSKSGSRFSAWELAIVGLVASLITTVQAVIGEAWINWDSQRYIEYAINILNYDVFGLASEDNQGTVIPGNANGPIYPYFLAFIAKLDPVFQQNLSCLISHEEQIAPSICQLKFRTLIFFQSLLVITSSMMVWILALRIFNNRIIAALASVLFLASLVPIDFAIGIMTEIITIPLLIAFQLCFILFYQTKHIWRAMVWTLIMGVTLGLLALTRPNLLYLAYFTFAAFTFAVIWYRTRILTLSYLSLTLSFIVTISPWAMRNYEHFGSPKLVVGEYAELTLAQRLAYNRMSFAEWSTAFLYYSPDFGQSLAEAYFPKSWWGRFDNGPNSFWQNDAGAVLAEGIKAAGGQDKVVSFWLKDLASNPIKHIAVTIPLTWRGLMLANYWGFFGLIAVVWALIETIRRRQYDLLLASLPIFILVGFHAAISPNFPRYNLGLLSIYSLALGWAIHHIGYIRQYKKGLHNVEKRLT